MIQGAVVLGGAVAVWLALHGPLRAVQRDGLAVRTVKLLRDALERYRAQRGRYVELTPLTAGGLVPILVAAGCLDRPPSNPYTGQPYGADEFEIDKIWYAAGPGGSSYELEALTYEGDQTLFVVDGRSPR